MNFCCQQEPAPERVYYPRDLYEQWEDFPCEWLGESITLPGGSSAVVTSAPYCRLYWPGVPRKGGSVPPGSRYMQWDTEGNYAFPSRWAFFPDEKPLSESISRLKIPAKRLRNCRYRAGGAIFNTPVDFCQIIHLYPGVEATEEEIDALLGEAIAVQGFPEIGKAPYLERRGTFLKVGANFLSYTVLLGRHQIQVTPRYGKGGGVPAELPPEMRNVVLQQRGKNLVPIARVQDPKGCETDKSRTLSSSLIAV